MLAEPLSLPNPHPNLFIQFSQFLEDFVSTSIIMFYIAFKKNLPRQTSENS